VIGHQTKAVNLPRGLEAGLLSSAQEELAILAAPKDDFLVITAIHDVVNRPGVMNTHLASHKDQPRQAARAAKVNQENMTICLTDPFSASIAG
jgi:hypothetical protein